MATPRPRLLDLFCGGGGCSVGYYRAGFDVVGVDMVRQPEYPFEFHLGNALTYPLDGFDAVHASPPCKAFTPAGNGARQAETLFPVHDDLLTPMLDRLSGLTIPWVVENVPNAPMPSGSAIYCGSSFGLDVRRHRLFASNVPVVAPACDHGRWTPRFQSLDWKARTAGKLASVVSVHGNLQGGADTLELRRQAMGIKWMSNDRLTQAIPPAYTEHIGGQLLHALKAAA